MGTKFWYVCIVCSGFVFGIIRSFLAVSTHPFMSQIIPRELYTQSATWNSTAWHIGLFLGPVLVFCMVIIIHFMPIGVMVLLVYYLFVLLFVLLSLNLNHASQNQR